MILRLQPTNFGYLLFDDYTKFVFNRTKKSNSKVDYYLKQVYPEDKYISGMFKQRDLTFLGKTKDNKKVKLVINGTTCNLFIN